MARLHLTLLLAGFMLLLATGCQADGIAEAQADAAAAALIAEPALPEPTPTPLPPVVNALPAATVALEMPSFAPEEPATATPPATATSAAPAGPTATASATITPQPTYTPPSLPLTSPDEHYWFRRPVADGGIVWTNKVYPYGSTRSGQLRPHHGVEFDVPYNTDILSVASGTVVVAGSDDIEVFGPQLNFYGNLVVIEHDSRWQGQLVYTLYGHLNEVLVQVGQTVGMQEVIGLSGATGVADGPHMHFEVRLGANTYEHTRNPKLWLYPYPDHSAVAGRVVWPDGSLVEAAPVTLRRIDAVNPYQATTTYTGSSVNADDALKENFVIDDVAAGFYEIEVNTGEKKFKQEFWVFPYRTAFVEIVIGD